jgi:hypothetical protein
VKNGKGGIGQEAELRPWAGSISVDAALRESLMCLSIRLEVWVIDRFGRLSDVLVLTEEFMAFFIMKTSPVSSIPEPYFFTPNP